MAYVITLAGAMMGDTNNDSTITAEDALDVLKKVVELIDHFKAEEVN